MRQINTEPIPIERGRRNIREKNRWHRFSITFRVLLGTLVVAAIIIAIMIYENTKTFSSYSVTASVPRTLADGAKTVEFDGTVLSYSKDGANAVDATGKLLWNQTFDMQSPLISICEDTVAFADYGGSTIYIQKSDGEAETVTTDMPIRKITVSSSDYVAAILADTDVTWIYLYDFNGKEIAYFRTTMEKSGYPVDFDISPDGELVVVSYYYLDCEDVKSSVAFFNFGPVGQNNIDNYVSGYNYSDSLVPLVRFLDSETAISVSSERLSVYAGAHKPVSVSDMFVTDDIQSVYYDKDVIAIVYLNSTGNTKYRLEVYNTSGETLSSYPFDFDYSDVTFGNDNVVLYGDTSIYIGTYSGDVKYEGSYTSPILLVVPTVSASKYTVVTDSSVDTVEFK